MSTAAADQERVVRALAGDLASATGVEPEWRETHGSTVLLTPDRAYKLKKAVRFDFVDQLGSAARRAACEREVALNAELAPGLVLGVRGVKPAPDGGFRLGAPGSPDAVDWVVEMVRFDEGRTLEALLLRGEEPARAVAEAIGARLAEFHLRAPVAHPLPLAMFEANLTALLELPLEDAATRVAGGLLRFAEAVGSGWGVALRRRADAGLVVDGHGDLRAEHVLLDEKGIRFVDRLEIDALRAVDVADDLAFLIMDLERLGASRTAERVLEGYEHAGGAAAPPALRAAFGAHRAAVRAKVAVLRGAPEEATAFLALARRLAWRARGPLVLLVTGPPASGKSTLAAALGAASGLPVLSSDVLRRVDGAPPVEYTVEHRAAVYAELGRRVAQEPAVIVDATFGARELQRAFLEQCRSHPGRPLLAVACTLDPGLRDERARARALAGSGPSDAGPVEAAALAARHLDGLEEADGRLAVDTAAPVKALVELVEAWLDARLAHGAGAELSGTP